MGKTVTYGIEYARTDPALEGFKFYMNRYKSLVNNSKPLLAFETILELTEWLVDESDDEVGDSPKFNSCLQGAITMCRQCLKSIQPPEFLPRAYAALSQAHLLLHDFQAAIEYGLKTIEHPLDKQLLQTAYRTMGNIYFTKSSDPEKSRFSDFSNALHYYQLERSVIDQMKDDEEDKVKQRLIQSSYFNMGVMQSKLSDHHSESEGNLRMAIQMAQQLNDAVSERTAWWELSNLFKRSGHYELVKECQENEYQLIQQHGFTDDALYCFEEQSNK
ncbi:uncharacterized protein BX663DRAFT_262511 [Cokeromyces recurvatus]|uniref:uncharacterized protein n=1 Tax=Cokeromyces recurvatus TaxID=90255 RepID=UPI00222006AF|nr:uncharacterized protein BX663DRAFT_262511 [Cokeromyces recurvatus]KAI7898425.1 hypothetical protein BX663DRAFT_262511 [Cokeromyces recurvatus]